MKLAGKVIFDEAGALEDLDSISPAGYPLPRSPQEQWIDRNKRRDKDVCMGSNV